MLFITVSRGALGVSQLQGKGASDVTCFGSLFTIATRSSITSLAVPLSAAVLCPVDQQCQSCGHHNIVPSQRRSANALTAGLVA